MEAAHEERLPKLAPTGRAGVRAMKGPFDGSSGGRRRFDAASPEPMRPTRSDQAFRHDPPLPAGSVSACVTDGSNRTFVQTPPQKWRSETERTAVAARPHRAGDRVVRRRAERGAEALARPVQPSRCTASKAAPRSRSCSETSVESRLKAPGPRTGGAAPATTPGPPSRVQAGHVAALLVGH